MKINKFYTLIAAALFLISATILFMIKPTAQLEEDLPMAEETIPVVQQEEPLENLIEVSSGDTLASLLDQYGIEKSEAQDIIKTLSTKYSPSQLRAGQTIGLNFEKIEGIRTFASLDIPFSKECSYKVIKAQDGGYKAQEIKVELTRQLVKKTATINSSLFQSGAKAKIPQRVLSTMMKHYAHDVDFQRDLQPGDQFSVIYEEYVTPEGEHVREGEMLYAALNISGKTKLLYQHKLTDGTIDYFDATAQSNRKTLLRTPIDGARLSSKFGHRKHPILGYTKMHKGVDFAAPHGTPIFAAGDGVIVQIGFHKGGYGNYVKIKHNGRVSSAYGHMSRFAKKKKGERVRQGEIIGYVGATGSATGPHLHFELLENETQVNPLKVSMPAGQKLSGKELQRFKSTIETLHTTYGDLSEIKPDPNLHPQDAIIPPVKPNWI